MVHTRNIKKKWVAVIADPPNNLERLKHHVEETVPASFFAGFDPKGLIDEIRKFHMELIKLGVVLLKLPRLEPEPESPERIFARDIGHPTPGGLFFVGARFLREPRRPEMDEAREIIRARKQHELDLPPGIHFINQQLVFEDCFWLDTEFFKDVGYLDGGQICFPQDPFASDRIIRASNEQMDRTGAHRFQQIMGFESEVVRGRLPQILEIGTAPLPLKSWLTNIGHNQLLVNPLTNEENLRSIERAGYTTLLVPKQDRESIIRHGTPSLAGNVKWVPLGGKKGTIFINQTHQATIDLLVQNNFNVIPLEFDQVEFYMGGGPDRGALLVEAFIH